MNQVITALDLLWSKYRTGERGVRPPTLDRIIGELQGSRAYLDVRREVKAVLSGPEFIKVKEKDNCGISWYCYCHRDSEYMKQLLNSPNKA